MRQDGNRNDTHTPVRREADIILLRGDETRAEFFRHLLQGLEFRVGEAVMVRETLCAGEVTFENGRFTGAKPGRLVRGAQEI